MASAHIVYTKIKSGHPILSNEIVSQTVLTGNTSTIDPNQSSYNFCSISAIGGDVWIAFANGDATPDPSTNPRYLVKTTQREYFTIQKDTKIGVLNA
jgi:hypothetical protein